MDMESTHKPVDLMGHESIVVNEITNITIIHPRRNQTYLPREEFAINTQKSADVCVL